VSVWLDPLRRELDAASAPRTFYFRDDDAGWATDRLLPLLDLFERHQMPLDVAVIPAALDARLAEELRCRRDRAPALLAFHQHGFAHANHEPSGRPYEFGPSRSRLAQRADIARGAERLRALLGETQPIFTPPWNRCTETTGGCLVALGFRALVRDSTARPLELDELPELQVHVDWSSRTELGRVLAASREGPTGVMLHHALLDAPERADVAALIGLLASHEHARCVALSEVLRAADGGYAARTAMSG
jgi:peptidoglycan/xylan/chitin deacetylase (PgdA/CDA1 family)